MKTRGFTTLEIIAGVILIVVFIDLAIVGQRIILNSKVAKTVDEVAFYQTQLQTYRQKYGALPGDDPAALSRFPVIEPIIANGNGDGVIDGAFDARDIAESRLAWAHLRVAGLVSRGIVTPATDPPPNPFGGIFGFQNGAFRGALTTTVLCFDRIPGAAAETIDKQLDDGKPDGGSIQATITSAAGGANGAAVTSYSEKQVYTMCARME